MSQQPDQDLGAALQQQVQRAFAAGQPLTIRGSGSKDFLGQRTVGEPLEVSGHSGILRYDPTELVITARAGTPLAQVEEVLAQAGQMLPFEPPHFGPGATLGGTIAANLSGPRRPYTGAARDFVLGSRVLNGRGELLHFGGEVMKNVAGYDLSRLMAGAMGTLGVLLEISLKVLPRAESELTLTQACDATTAIDRFHGWARLPWPISAAAHLDGRLYLRLAGTAGAVAAARAAIGGDALDQGDGFWRDLREQQLPFFAGEQPLWRLSLPGDAETADLGTSLIDWGGAQRWLRSDAPVEHIRASARRAGGHATLYRGLPETRERYQPLASGIARLHRELKQACDPKGILNPGRLYPDL